jgi:tripartite-type tricarboxylate transporter receptor subunit TctC
MKRFWCAALWAIGMIAAQAAPAAEWPTKPVTIIVTTAAGGNTDMMARMAADFLSTKFGVQFVVENRPSAGGALATGAVAAAAPDGYSLLFTPSSAFNLTPLIQKLSFDPGKSLVPVTNVGTGSQVIAVKRSIPATNLAEFLAYAKANPGKLNFAAAGTNNLSHLAPLLLFKLAGAEVVMVPSRGEPTAITDLMAGYVDFYFGNTSALLAHRDHPAIRLLAVGTPERVATAPDIPSASETVPGFVFASWNGFLVPRGTPDAIVERLRAAVTEMTRTPAVAERLLALGIVPGGQTKEQVEAALAADRKNYGDAVKAAGIAPPK